MSTSRGALVYAYAAVEDRVDSAELSALTPMPGGQPLRPLPVDARCTLVVSNVPAGDYEAGVIEARLRDLDWVAAAGAAHHAVVDALAAAHAVLPFRMLTIFSGDEAARRAVRAVRARVAAAFDRVRGRQEWVLRIGRPDPARTATPAAPPAKATSGRGFLQAKADARRAEAERAARVAAAVPDVFEALRALADAASSRPVQSGEEVLLDAAFLIDAARVDAFRAALQQAADGLLRDGCRVSLTGPWPPYSFASFDAHADE